jgi:hypothetical protein
MGPPKPDQGEIPGYGDDIDGKPACPMGPPKPDQGDMPGYGDDKPA